MPQLSNFCSVLEIGFATNAILYFFDLKQTFDKYLEEKIIKLGNDELDLCLEKKDRHFIFSYGWRSLVFGYSIWLSRLKILSVSASFASLFLLIYSGINPSCQIGYLLVLMMIIFIFGPIASITLIIIYGLPYYKLHCMKTAMKEILERDKQKLEETDYLKRKESFDALIRFLEFKTFPNFYLVKNFKKKKSMDFSALFKNFKEN